MGVAMGVAGAALLSIGSMGLQNQIKLVAIDLLDRPNWYKEKVYPPNQVPALEHNGKVIGESLDLIRK
ncbi:hypothetical protein MLD38_029839 [Melastoma candidum]|uniref:Uncharacterized protein n=1 Tax=Melastoma candidum TaxID=119954 RepID=A0ACB9N4Y3_9MYRT|nr:hypothetical protein MLD38_029839 [Melastoma candidum]